MLIIGLICAVIILSSAASKRLLMKQLFLFALIFGVVAAISGPFIYDRVFTKERLSRIDGFCIRLSMRKMKDTSSLTRTLRSETGD